MSDLEVKLVKVDNWGIYFLQRLKHFFNRTDYCDLTLQFQDNAQLKVHRLVLSACTEYFELLERTCEMYEDCLVMPDDLQADVVVPIVNFMYTGQLEFRMDLLERLYLTSQIMDMPVLTKLLDAHRNQATITPLKTNVAPKRSYSKHKESHSTVKQTSTVSSNTPMKRQFATAFSNVKKTVNVPEVGTNNGMTPLYHKSDVPQISSAAARKVKLGEPRPTRYELPEELDTDNIFDNSFTNISYTSSPLMVHPDSSKHYPSKKSSIFGEASGSRKFAEGTSTVDIVECKKMSRNENIFEDDTIGDDDADMYQVREQSSPQVFSQLFDQIIEQNDGPKVTIVTKDAKQESNIDHAKIISEVLKKYPHLVKSNKNIKLKILNTPSSTANKAKPNKRRKPNPNSPQRIVQDGNVVKIKSEKPDYTYETDVLDSKEAARLIALGADNTQGPWICLICGTPGKALHFTSYYKFRRHLVEVHNEKPVSNMCEYCGLKSGKRNYLLHHLLTKHGVEPPPSYHFPKCNLCNYVALTEGFLIKHKSTHSDHKNFRCNVCIASFVNSNQLLDHIRNTGHKYSAENKRPTLQCIYCMKVFTREGSLYAHLKITHKQLAKADGIIDDSDEEQEQNKTINVKYEPQAEYEEDTETQYQIRPDGNLEVIPKSRAAVVTTSAVAKQKILNSGFSTSETKTVQKTQPAQNLSNVQDELNEEVVMIDNTEYVMRDNQLIPKKKDEYILPEMLTSQLRPHLIPSTSLDYSNTQNTMPEVITQQKMILKKSTNINQPIQIVVSNEEEYKALMNSNHSIIFDDGDTNKTLTVLSTPEGALNATGLELESTQSNDMMIIQDNYPLNVSEALPSDNSNIVVVYGHSVGDQNKQFQIITSQDMGPQFVQTSAVITQNFGTLSTSAPVMSAHVIDAQVEETWQNNIQNSQHDSDIQEMTEITVMQQNEITTIDTQSTIALNELPEITLTPGQPQAVTENQLQENFSKSNVADNINGNNQPVIDVQNAAHISMDVDTSTELVADTTELVTDTTEPVTVTIDPVVDTIETDTREPVTDTMELVSEKLCETFSNTVIPITNTMEMVTNNSEVVTNTTEVVTNTTELVTDTTEEVTDTTEVVTDTTEVVTNTTEVVTDTTEVVTDTTEVVTDTTEVVTDTTEVVTDTTEVVTDTTEVVTDTTEVVTDTTEVVTDTTEVVTDTTEVVTDTTEVVTETVIDDASAEKFDRDSNDPLPESETYTEPEDNINEDQMLENVTSAKGESEELDAQDPAADIEDQKDDVPVKENYPKTIAENSGIIITKVVKEQIQSITSEWSEDEYDVIEEKDDDNIENNKEREIISGVESEEVEESIENIQQEMDKQLVSEPAGEVEHGESDNLSNLKKQPASLLTAVAPLEKISSLLNDWDENDSQGNDSFNGTGENETIPTTVPENAIKEINTELDKQNPKKDDKIQSLVSDWDDDDEDAKAN